MTSMFPATPSRPGSLMSLYSMLAFLFDIACEWLLQWCTLQWNELSSVFGVRFTAFISGSPLREEETLR